MNNIITIQYGAGNSVTKDRNGYTTVGAILSDRNLRAILGFGDNTEARINGLAASPDMAIPAGAVIDLVAKASSKA